MPALPLIETEESTRRNSAEKKCYRLSLRAESKKTFLGDSVPTNKQSSVNNEFDVSSEGEKSTGTFEPIDHLWYPSSRYFQDAAINSAILTPPTPSPSLKVTHRRKQHKSAEASRAVPRWLDALGIWVPAKQKLSPYQSFSKNVILKERSRDFFLDPFPYLPRCNHARTLSALHRQRQRLQEEDYLRRKERCLRIIDRLTQLREVWDSWKDKSESIGTEHLNRLDTFRKTKEMYTEPSEIIRKRREERQLREKEFREKERKRLLELEQKRRRIPRIIFTNYDEEIALRESRTDETQTEAAAINASSKSHENSDEENQNPKNENLKDEAEADGCPQEIGSTECESKVEPSGVSLNYLIVPARAAEDIPSRAATAAEDIPSRAGGDFEVTQSGVNFEGRDFGYENSLIGDSTATDSMPLTTQQANPISTENVAVGGSTTLLAEGAEQTNTTNTANSVVTDGTKSLTRDETASLQILMQSAKKKLVAQAADSGNDETLQSTGKGDSQGSGRNFGYGKSRHVLAGKEESKEIVFDSNMLSAPSLSSLSHHGQDLWDNIGAADETVCLMSTSVPVPLGVADGLISDSAIRASSSQDRYRRPNQARLHNTPQGKHIGAWQPKTNDKKQFLQVDLGSVATIKQVATQGCPSGNETSKHDKCWVKSYSLAFSNDGKKWQQYREETEVKEFRGNQDNDTVVVNSLGSPMEAQFVRFLPRSWKNSIAMRVEVFGEFPEVESQATASLAGDQELLEEESLVEQAREGELNNELFFAEALTSVDSEEAWEENMAGSVSETTQVLMCTGARVTRSSFPPLMGLAVQGSKSLTAKRRLRKPKSEKEEKKKKKRKSKKLKLPSLVPLDDVPDEDETGQSSPDEEQEGVSEEDPLFKDPLFEVPPLPELPQRKESDTQPRRTRTMSMFSSVPPTIEDPKPKLRRIKGDNSIRIEMLRQQLAEDRRQKLRSAMDKLKKRDYEARTPSPDFSVSSPFVDDYLAKNCIFGDGQRKYYQRIFNSFDEDQDGYLFPEEVLEALEFVNSNLLSDSHLNYIYRVLDLCDCSLDSGADIKLFSVVAALSQRVAALDDFAKILMAQLDFKELDYKLQKAKMLFTCYVDEATKTIPLEYLMLDLMAGGLGSEYREQIMKTLGRTSSLDFLDFLTYIPLFIHIHDHVLSDPLGSVT